MSIADELPIKTLDEMWDVVSDLPPSAKLIVKVLEYNGTLTQSELVDKSRLSPRTVRHALKELDKAGVVESEISLADARQKLYSLKIEPWVVILSELSKTLQYSSPLSNRPQSIVNILDRNQLVK